MDFLMLLLVVLFLGLLAAGFVFFSKEPKIPTVDPPKGEDHKKKMAALEGKLKDLEYRFEATALELTQTKEREKALLKEKSQVSFDSEQYEKFKKEHQALKAELSHKEEALEQEISQRRQEASESAQIRTDHAALKKKLSETEDALRKSQFIAATLSNDLSLAKKTIEEQKKIVLEHTQNQAEGEWVSRLEFNRIGKELKEKEAMIQKLLAIKKDLPPQP